ncbi:spermatogenesis-associated protein 22 isoform X1 [Ascaphus truei]|uniref:spermatogenesis-associated protein 22 isoform X1 n=1 Tax=Ascaphus truei TaxID=8439 RepID=UPI003F59AA24
MKRSFPDHSKRAAPGYLPVPLFNPKKRNRQPLTSIPQRNEPSTSGINLVPESFDFSAMSTDLVWESRIPQPNYPGKGMDGGLSHPVSHHLVNQQYKPQTTGCNAISTGEKQNIWPGDENMHKNSRTDVIFDTKGHYEQMHTLGGLKQQRSHEHHSLQMQSRTKLSDQVSLTTFQRPLQCHGTSTGTKDHKSSYSFKNSIKISKDNVFTDMPEEEMVQKVPIYQVTFKEKGNSLRIIPASIDSMKHWSQYTDKIALLFEVLATLDSAVTSGDNGSKIFLLRDGKNNVPCVFYEIDRDLPRLIRGRVHRSMGNYDKKRNLFKCVSVRPASVGEQQTFQEFISAANDEMQQYEKTMNEV